MKGYKIYDSMMQELAKLLSLTLLSGKSDCPEMQGFSLILGDIHDSLRDQLKGFESDLLPLVESKGSSHE